MSAIFISHSSADNAWAATIASWLEAAGHASLFLDFDPNAGIQAGERWRDIIFRQLRGSQLVLALCSESFLASQWCLSEVAIALGLCKPVVPLLIGTGELPQLLRETQAIDFRGDRDDGFRRLASGLDQHLKWRDRLRWDQQRPPYPGLEPCQEEDAPVFFGRDAEVEELLRRLRGLRQASRGLLLVLGASGCGKSSLLRAGLLPRLRLDPATWLVLNPVRPGDDPFDELTAVLREAFAAVGEAPPDTPRDGAILRRLLGRLRRSGGRLEACVVVPLDPLEELLHGEGGEGERFLRMVIEAVDDADGRLVVMATLRSDFLQAFQLHPADPGRQADQFLLGPMRREGLLQVIEGPAERVGLTLEPGFPLRLAVDTGSGEALPLLAFCLQELWEAHGAAGRFRLRDYEALGGLEQAVERAATLAIQPDTLADSERWALRQAFIPSMVRLTEQGGFTRRAARWEALPAAARPLLTELVKRRLLVRRGEGGEQTVEVVHEALLRRWPLLRGWLEEEREFLRGFEQLQRDQRQWREAPALERAELLLPKGKLEKARQWQRTHPNAFEGELRPFLEASASHQRASRQRTTTLAALFLLSLLLTGLGLVRLSPRLSARLLVPLATLTGTPALISAALGALRQHRLQLLRADKSVFAVRCDRHSRTPFCVSERQTMQLLKHKNAPHSIQTVKALLAQGTYGGWNQGLSRDHTKGYTEGALKRTASLFFNSQAAGADLDVPPDGGTINSRTEAWLIPCELLEEVEQLWTQLPPAPAPHHQEPSCPLFPEDPAEGDYSNPDCFILKQRLPNGDIREKKTLGFWLFDPEQFYVYERYSFCRSRPRTP